MDNGKPTHFATFGSGQLKDFRADPMRVLLTMGDATRDELRQRLQQEPFNNKYSTTYPISEAERMASTYNMTLIDMEMLLNMYEGAQNA